VTIWRLLNFHSAAAVARCSGSTRGLKGSFLYSLIRLAARKLSLVGLAVTLTGCTVYKPHPDLMAGSLSQVRTQSDGPVRVTAAVLGAENSPTLTKALALMHGSRQNFSGRNIA
jgi:hypothetical protein